MRLFVFPPPRDSWPQPMVMSMDERIFKVMNPAHGDAPTRPLATFTVLFTERRAPYGLGGSHVMIFKGDIVEVERASSFHDRAHLDFHTAMVIAPYDRSKLAREEARLRDMVDLAIAGTKQAMADVVRGAFSDLVDRELPEIQRKNFGPPLRQVLVTVARGFLPEIYVMHSMHLWAMRGLSGRVPPTYQAPLVSSISFEMPGSPFTPEDE